MLGRARRLLVACLLVAAGCSGSDDSDGDLQNTDDPSNADGDGDNGDGDNGDGDNGDGDTGDGDNGDGDAGDGDGPIMADPDGDPADACQDGGEALATGLGIKEISLYQVVKIPVYENGSWLSERIAPIIQNKKTLVRVFVEPQGDFEPHGLRAVLTLDNGGAPKWLTDDATIEGASEETDAGSTFNFQVEAGDITTSTRISVALVEKSCPEQIGSASLARFPESGTQDLQAKQIGKLRVKVVPVRLSNGDLPDTSAEQIEKMRQTFLALYPVSEVEISVRGMLDWGSDVGSFGNGWSELLEEILTIRQNDGASDDEYYYGLITPTTSIESFCSSGCVLGLAPGGSEDSVYPPYHGALGIGYTHPETYMTMAHEVAHTHGRLHAPCAPGGQIQGIDRSYPDSNAATGSWGWDFRSNELKNPQTKDFMSYCTPVWTSAYTYAALARRSLMVNKAVHTESQWQQMILMDEGRARWGRIKAYGRPHGESEVAFVKDAAGNTVKEIEVIRTSLSDVDDSFLALPKPEKNWATVVLYDREIALDTVLPPRTK